MLLATFMCVAIQHLFFHIYYHLVETPSNTYSSSMLNAYEREEQQILHNGTNGEQVTVCTY
jgi:hypothetical protein